MVSIKKFWGAIILLLLILVLETQAQNSKAEPLGVIGFYNLENLFDTVDDPAIRDEEYLADGKNSWTEERYQGKLQNMSKVIAEMAGGPDILGLCEIENRQVLEDLVTTPKLIHKRYQIVHFDSPDRRGIDVGLIYKSGKFTPFHTALIPLVDPDEPDFRTRDMLWVKGLYKKDTLNIVINHWPSRRGGKEYKRILAGQTLRAAIDSVQRLNPDAKIVLMGDFNDDPSNKSIRKELKASGKRSSLNEDQLFNTASKTFKLGYGTLAYRGAWNLFDQIIVSQSLLKEKTSSYAYVEESFSVFGPDWMRIRKGEGAGNPLRTFSRGVFKNGYSDHFPTYIVLGQY